MAKAGCMVTVARSLGGRRIVGCRLAAAVYFSPISCQISRYSPAKSSKTCPSLGPVFARAPSSAQAPGGCQVHPLQRGCSVVVAFSNVAQLKQGAYRLWLGWGFKVDKGRLLISCKSRANCRPAASITAWPLPAVARVALPAAPYGL
jgi:hypothetical protein